MYKSYHIRTIAELYVCVYMSVYAYTYIYIYIYINIHTTTTTTTTTTANNNTNPSGLGVLAEGVGQREGDLEERRVHERPDLRRLSIFRRDF